MDDGGHGGHASGDDALDGFVDHVEMDEIHGTLVMVLEPMPCSL